MPHRERTALCCITLAVSRVTKPIHQPLQAQILNVGYVQKLMVALGKSNTGRNVTILRVPTPYLPSNITDRAPASLHCQPNKTRSLYNPNNLTTHYKHLIIHNVQLKSEPRHTASLTAGALLTHRQSYCCVYGTLHHQSALFQSVVCIKRVTCTSFVREYMGFAL